MYSSPEALKIYGEYSGLPENIVQRVVKLIPKEALQTDEVKNLDAVMANAVTQKFLSAPLTPQWIAGHACLALDCGVAGTTFPEQKRQGLMFVSPLDCEGDGHF